jgi:glycerol-3-phosphate acyltransferase PlsY
MGLDIGFGGLVIIMLLPLMPLIVGYLVGSIPFGLVLTRLAGYGDIRQIGSGNIGATNVLRTGNKFLAFLTLLLDAGKGAFLILIFDALGDWDSSMDFIKLLLGLGAILGHCFPIWLKFKGGKGVSTTLGTLLATVPIVGLIACATWLVMALALRISSLSALTAMAIASIATFFIYGTAPAIIVLLIAALVFIRHKDNIKRILNGTEPRIGHKKKNEQPVSTETNE